MSHTYSHSSSTMPKTATDFWSQRLATKLAALTSSSSKETHQIIAHWLAFHRRHLLNEDECTFRDKLIATLVEQPDSILPLLHEVLLLNFNSHQWTALEGLREVIGEQILLPVAEQLPSTDRVTELGKEWDEKNVFGGPVLWNRIKKRLGKKQQESTATPREEDVDVTEQVDNETEVAQDPQPTSNQATEMEVTETAVKKEQTKDASPVEETGTADMLSPLSTPSKTKSSILKKTTGSQDGSTTTAISFDFDATGISAKDHGPLLLEKLTTPSKELSTLQIARDLRHDSTVTLSGLLSALPLDVRTVCAEQAEKTDNIECPLSEEQAEQFSKEINPQILDMNLEEQLETIQEYRTILHRQVTARNQLRQLLIESRCKLGAEGAAKAFQQQHSEQSLDGQLQQKSQVLIDAMELEGIAGELEKEMEMNSKKRKQAEQSVQALEPLSWY